MLAQSRRGKSRNFHHNLHGLRCVIWYARVRLALPTARVRRRESETIKQQQNCWESEQL